MSIRTESPRLLLIDTSGKIGRVALALGAELGEVRTLDESRRHARDLAPTISELCASRDWRVRDLEGVIVCIGPGSYTGLRVGVISAKALAFATGCDVIGLETFAVIARQVPPEASEVDVLADAQQQNLYVQRWRRLETGWEAEPLRIEAARDWRAGLKPGVWITGPGLRQHEASIPEVNPLVPTSRREPQAATMLELGMERWRRGERNDLWSLEPLYLRPSNAEENWDRRTA